MKKPRRRRCMICGDLHHVEAMSFAYDVCAVCCKIYFAVNKHYPRLGHAATVDIARAVQSKGMMIEASKTIH